jgi:hypothetical protein
VGSGGSSLYSVYASLVPSHDASSIGDRYVFYATDVGNAAYLGVLNLSSLQLSVRSVPQLSDWTEMACDSTTYALAPPPSYFYERRMAGVLVVLVYSCSYQRDCGSGATP